MPKASVIIPTYNRAQYIINTVKSVINQTYKDFEIIIVDDGSEDNTKEVIENIAKNNQNIIQYIYQNNKGPAAARNTGIINAKGDYIAFLDSDDYWMPNKLEEQFNYFIANPSCNVLHNEVHICNLEGKIIQVNSHQDKAKREGWLFDEIILLKTYIFLSSLIVNKDVFKKVGRFAESLYSSEDVELFLRLALEYKIGFINKPLVRRIIHESSITGSGYLFGNRGTVECLDIISDKLPSVRNKRKKLFKRAYMLRYRQIGMSLFSNGKYCESRYYYLKLMKMSMLDIKSLSRLIASYFPYKLLDYIRRSRKLKEII